MNRLSLFIVFIFITLTFSIGCTMDEPSEPKLQELKENPSLEVATFSGGCFWCMEAGLQGNDGIKGVISGFAGGEEENPAYPDVASGQTGHREAIQVYYNPDEISYTDLLELFWKQIDPTDAGGQFADRGFQYSTAIFYHTDEQKQLAEQSKQLLEESDKFDEPIATEIVPFSTFYPAETYHQNYFKKNPVRYNVYSRSSGRKGYIEETWKGWSMDLKGNFTFEKPSEDELQDELTPLQYDVTQNSATEEPFNNPYWDNKEEGIYVDIVSGEALFSSTHKYQSGTGWPSFTQPLDEHYIVERPDPHIFRRATEVRSAYADSHLGHVFSDGPEPTGVRYCMNSAALRFIPKEQMAKEGYGEYLHLFE